MTYSYTANLLFIIFSLQSITTDATHQPTSFDGTGYTSVYLTDAGSTASGISIDNTDQSTLTSSITPATQSNAGSTAGGTSISMTGQSTITSSIVPSTQSNAGSTAGGISIGNTDQSTLTSSITPATQSNAGSTAVGTSISMTGQSRITSSLAPSTQSTMTVGPMTNMSTNAVQTISSSSPLSSVTSAPLSTVTSNVPSSNVSSMRFINRTYQYTITSNVSLKVGVINDSNVLLSILTFVRASFNLTNVTTVASIARAEIQRNARAITSTLLTDITFNTVVNCSDDCFDRSITPISSPTANLTLLSDNGVPVQITSASAPVLWTGPSSSSTATPQSFEKGESPPGRAAQLGMGLGISFLAVIIAAEIVFLYKKYGCSTSARSSDYELRYHQDDENI